MPPYDSASHCFGELAYIVEIARVSEDSECPAHIFVAEAVLRQPAQQMCGAGLLRWSENHRRALVI